MDRTYRVKVYLTAVDRDRARQLREVLGRYLKKAGKEPLRDLMRRAHEGERVLLYESNDDKNAQVVADDVSAHGGTVEIEGLRPPEEPF